MTLVECLVACSVAVTLTALALPSWRGHQLRASRIDAVDALMRLQLAQERHLGLHGLYAGDLSALTGVGDASRQGRYTLTLATTGVDAYRATAQARGDQAQDSDCRALTLEVRQSIASIGPSARCWNR